MCRALGQYLKHVNNQMKANQFDRLSSNYNYPFLQIKLFCLIWKHSFLLYQFILYVPIVFCTYSFPHVFFFLISKILFIILIEVPDHLFSVMTATKMHFLLLWMRLMPLLLINGGRKLSIASHLFLHILLHGCGRIAAGKRNCNCYVILFGLSMITHVYVPAALEHYMKDLRFFYAQFHFESSLFLILT